jgi:hypothetical protein
MKTELVQCHVQSASWWLYGSMFFLYLSLFVAINQVHSHVKALKP